MIAEYESTVRDAVIPTALPRLLYLGEVPIESSYHGSAALFRLLQHYPTESLLVLERTGRTSQEERRLPGVRYGNITASWKYGARFLRTRLGSLFWPTWKVLAQKWARLAEKSLFGFEVEAVLTVQEGSLWLAAYFLARRLGVPFHLVVHDDWLRSVELSSKIRSSLEMELGAIYRAAAGRFCVSPYMERMCYQRYGKSGVVLYPSRAPDARAYQTIPEDDASLQRPFTVAYAGSTFDGGYLEGLKLLAMVLQDLGGRLLLFGPFSSNEVSEQGLNLSNVSCLGLCEARHLIETLRKDADALFVPMSFDEADRENMTVGFPSKLTDYTATGRPIIVRGPSYCSAVQWAKANPGCCEIVEESSAETLRATLARVMADPQRRRQLGSRALEVGKRYFAHDAAQTVFFKKLTGCA